MSQRESLHAVIMAGGSGTRFWPASRASRPKQLLPLCHGKTLLASTVDRVRGIVDIDHIWVVTSPDQIRGVRETLPNLPEQQVLVEPEPRDTAPCVALASAVIEARDPGATMAVMPADHLIEPESAFHELMRRGAALANGDHLVTFGITPTHAATGFGYIELGDTIDDGTPAAYHAARFLEKPDQETATGFFNRGSHLWNSGIFVWRHEALLAAMDVADPELAVCTRAMLAAAQAGNPDGLAEQFMKAARTSIDLAVMERAPNVLVVRAELSWNDLGSFLGLDTVGDTDGSGNVVLSSGSPAFLESSEGCVVYSEGKQTVTLFGARDLVVVAVDDALLVCPKDRAQDLKALVQALQKAGRDDLL